MEVTIRAATESDYDDLCSLFEEVDALHREHLSHVYRQAPGPARDKEHVRVLLGDENATLLVAEWDEQLVGLIYVIIQESPHIPVLVPRRWAKVEDIVVHESFRFKGIGRALLEEAQEWAQAQGADSIELNVWEFNQEAMRFYHLLGFETDRRRMSKRLP